MTIQQWAIVAVLLPAVLTIAALLWAEERQLRRTFKMFGTTGFWDVDRRMRLWP